MWDSGESTCSRCRIGTSQVPRRPPASWETHGASPERACGERRLQAPGACVSALRAPPPPAAWGAQAAPPLAPWGSLVWERGCPSPGRRDEGEAATALGSRAFPSPERVGPREAALRGAWAVPRFSSLHSVIGPFLVARVSESGREGLAYVTNRNEVSEGGLRLQAELSRGAPVSTCVAPPLPFVPAGAGRPLLAWGLPAEGLEGTACK